MKKTLSTKEKGRRSVAGHAPSINDNDQKIRINDNRPVARVLRIQHNDIAKSNRSFILQRLGVSGVVQLKNLDKGNFNVAGEAHFENKYDHKVAGIFRYRETTAVKYIMNSDNYWNENTFTYKKNGRVKFGDPKGLRYDYIIQMADEQLSIAKDVFDLTVNGFFNNVLYSDYDYSKNIVKINASKGIRKLFNLISKKELTLFESKFPAVGKVGSSISIIEASVLQCVVALERRVESCMRGAFDRTINAIQYGELKDALKSEPIILRLILHIIEGLKLVKNDIKKLKKRRKIEGRDISLERSKAMHRGAEAAAEAGQVGVWKVGQVHAKHMLKMKPRKYNLLMKDEFDSLIESYWAK